MSGSELYEVLRRIRPVHDLAARVVTESLEGRELTMPMRAILERLHEVGDQTVPDLARWLSVSRQGIQVVVDEARRLGHVQSQPNPSHRRSHLISLTGRGRTAFEELHADELGRLAGVAAEFSADDIAACVRVLDQLVVGLGDLTDSALDAKESTR
ncbi:MAG: MarR family winged helix-turn-helix transcriptional regulator [Propionibacteriaceae bacterium]